MLYYLLDSSLGLSPSRTSLFQSTILWKLKRFSSHFFLQMYFSQKLSSFGNSAYDWNATRIIRIIAILSVLKTDVFFDYELNYVASFHFFFQEKRIKIIIREILVHTSFVILCVLVVYASVDPNSQRLYQSAFNLVAHNGITNEYFDGKTYDRADFDPDGNPKDVQDAASVSTP